ncbi:hypothetical protein [Nonomuraea basaltis]|uniref:hypothetical protein n=1 Tax=Nonomuraea basaltis TaxID=2495887 RepID=UPI00110C6AFD|nr:hypothetical protein [Nonomuraea basaltis]TMR97286.1 hypothetical protein EJK15_18595 [Nonomuraea basaltis]
MTGAPAHVYLATVVWNDGRRFQHVTDTSGLAYKRAAETLHGLITDGDAPYIPHRYFDFLEDHPYDQDTATDEQAEQWVDLFKDQLLPDEQLAVEVTRFDVQSAA